MFSYEVKNYALLGYTGELVLRGVALRSSRIEPFAERFLRDALRAAMLGDIKALRATFLATLDALDRRALPAADLATRTRVTKSPEAYRQSRARHREAPYEALLAAGRERWAPGERVRYYRAKGGAYLLVPDEDEAPPERELPRDYDVEHYRRVLFTSCVARLKKAFSPEDFAAVFRPDGQAGLFDREVSAIVPIRIRCSTA
jgi:DNA polymerase elongation subunit (family B)